jgi:hypothetical protein
MKIGRDSAVPGAANAPAKRADFDGPEICESVSVAREHPLPFSPPRAGSIKVEVQIKN